MSTKFVASFPLLRADRCGADVLRGLILAGRELFLAPPELRCHGRHGVAEEVVQRLVHRAAHLQVSAQLCLHFTALTQPGSQG